MAEFPWRLRAARECRGWTQGYLASLAGIPAPSLSLYESGDRSPSLDNLSAIAGALVVSIDDLVNGRRGGTLTPAEHAVLGRLAQAWNGFIDLPVEHPDDRDEFRREIHRLQDMIMARPTRRAMAKGRRRPDDMTRKQICIDFDGIVGAPAPGAIRFLEALVLDSRFEVVVHARRVPGPTGMSAAREWLVKSIMTDRGTHHITAHMMIDLIPVVDRKPPAAVTISARAIMLDGT